MVEPRLKLSITDPIEPNIILDTIENDDPIRDVFRMENEEPSWGVSITDIRWEAFVC
jgi:hypothetical protein